MSTVLLTLMLLVPVVAAMAKLLDVLFIDRKVQKYNDQLERALEIEHKLNRYNGG